MARPKILRGTYVNLLLGDGNVNPGPEVFTPICGITTRTFTHQVNTNDTFVRDCADPEDVPSRETMNTGEQWDLSGSGLLNRSDLERMQAAVGQVQNWRYELGQPAGDAVYGGYYAGAAKLTNLTITGDDGQHVTVDLTIVSEGDWAFTAVP